MSLIEWVEKGEMEEVRKCIQQGADVNTKDVYGYSSLLWAACYGNTEILKLLLEKGADVDYKTQT